MSKNKTHTIYNRLNGEVVPSVTTILGMLDKPALMHWAWSLGVQNIDYRQARDTAASIGTIAHYLIECHLKKKEPDVSLYKPEDVNKAQTAFLAYIDFEKENHIEIIKSEISLVSEEFLYGGTIDCYCRLNGKLALIDFKTSSGLYPEMQCQVSAYKNLLVENGYTVEEVHLLRIDKETGVFEPYKMDLLIDEFELFKLLTKAYPLKKKLWSTKGKK